MDSVSSGGTCTSAPRTHQHERVGCVALPPGCAARAVWRQLHQVGRAAGDGALKLLRSVEQHERAVELRTTFTRTKPSVGCARRPRSRAAREQQRDRLELSRSVTTSRARRGHVGLGCTAARSRLTWPSATRRRAPASRARRGGRSAPRRAPSPRRRAARGRARGWPRSSNPARRSPSSGWCRPAR